MSRLTARTVARVPVGARGSGTTARAGKDALALVVDLQEGSTVGRSVRRAQTLRAATSVSERLSTTYLRWSKPVPIAVARVRLR